MYMLTVKFEYLKSDLLRSNCIGISGMPKVSWTCVMKTLHCLQYFTFRVSRLVIWLPAICWQRRESKHRG